MSSQAVEKRIDRYVGDFRFRPGLLGGPERTSQVSQLLGGAERPFVESLWKGTKEIIYTHGDHPAFTHIMYYLDAENLDVVLVAGVETVDLDTEGLRQHLSLAIAGDIPAFPNTPEDSQHLAALYDGILRDGVVFTDDGVPHKYVLKEQAKTLAHSGSPEELLVTDRALNPVEVMRIRGQIAGRLAELSAAQTTLGRIDAALVELDSCLNEAKRNEHALQACLTKHPILFGPEYRRVIPQHRLGDDYVMDYALERHSGFIDLVEIEASTLQLFTASGQPKSELVHAEQQILDWLEWIEARGDYARSKLSTLQRPRGIIVIGRSAPLSPKAISRLRQRNRVFADVLEIYTYDDLMTRTRHLRGLLLSGGDGGLPSSPPP